MVFINIFRELTRHVCSIMSHGDCTHDLKFSLNTFFDAPVPCSYSHLREYILDIFFKIAFFSRVLLELLALPVPLLDYELNIEH